MAIANALQLEAARCRAVPSRFNFVARAKFEVAQPIHCRLRALLKKEDKRTAVKLKASDYVGLPNEFRVLNIAVYNVAA